MMIKIDRWNGGTLRRYHFPAGKIVIGKNKSVGWLPNWLLRGAPVPITREFAAKSLLGLRHFSRTGEIPANADEVKTRIPT